MPTILDGTPWLQRGDVAHFAQFAVEPQVQGGGVGSQLLAYVETTAKTAGAKEIALDTADPATHLVDW